MVDPPRMSSSKFLIALYAVPAALLSFALGGCDRTVETEIIDVGCKFRDSGHSPPDADGSQDGMADRSDADTSEPGEDTMVGGVGEPCSSDSACRSGQCQSSPSGDYCTDSCSREDDPCSSLDFQCFDGTCVPRNYCEDGDGDGYGDGPGCKGADCDDTAPEAHPGAEEECGNGIDDDCDGETDEGTDQIFYRDSDGDGWGTNEETVRKIACMPPDGYTDDPGDCDDSNSEIHPGRTDECNEIDDDCDGDTDEDCNL